jgi:VIT1/CCC1 family predicted Fe2+/Mn2+ transporter
MTLPLLELEHEHTEEAIRERLAADSRPNYARDFVYGGIDGAVTTFAVVAGVSGAELSPTIVIIMGLANLLADGLSMAASNYSGTKTEVDDADRIRAVERKHIAFAPDGEREEVRQILAAKGLNDPALEDAVRAITGKHEVWIEFMVSEEYGLPRTQRSPLLAASSTFAAFILCGIVPLLPYLLGQSSAFASAAVLTGAVFFAIGSAKSHWSLQSWWRSGLETLAIGAIAAGAAYLVGYLLQGIVPAGRA